MKKYKYTRTFTYEGHRYYIRANTLQEIGEKKAMKLRDLQDGKVVVSSNMLTSNWISFCIDTYKTNQNAETKKKYKNRVDHNITSQIGSMPLSKVKPLHCQSIMNSVEGLSKTHVNEIYQALKFIFRHAKANGLISKDPTENLIKPKTKPRQTRRALTPQEREIIIKVGSTERRFYLFLLMLFCGCRPAEAENCMGKDLKTIDGYHMLHIRGTKTSLSDRFVPVPDTLYQLIKKTPADEYITARRYNRDRLWSSFKRALNIELGCKTYRNKLIPPYPLAPDLVPYCLRHEYCTELARQGIDIRHAQKLMGHSDISLTANIYTNLAHSDIIEVAKILSGSE